MKPLTVWVVIGVAALSAAAADDSKPTTAPSAPAVATQAAPTASPPAAEVHVTPIAHDDEIQRRLTKILGVTNLFTDLQVVVKDGVVFLNGRTRVEADKAWARDLARNTQDVVAVVDHIQVVQPSAWNFQPAAASLEEIQRGSIRSLPFLVCGAIILLLSYLAAVLATRWMRFSLRRRVPAGLLREVFARSVGMCVLLVGLYLTLRIANLTHLALTIVGGTGLLGLVLGIAFGNITENFLASILLSMQHPFQVGDLVEITGILGYVQRLTTRTTVMITLDGNEVQIPNASVYKSVLRNYTTIRNRREDFTVTVDRNDVDAIQQRTMDVLTHHPAVLHDPEPAVLVDSLTESGVVLRVYFWLDGKENSWLKVRSSVIRLIAHAVDYKSEPAATEPARHSASRATAKARAKHNGARSPKDEAVVAQGEGSLDNEAQQIEEQAHDARHDHAENLLAPSADGAAHASKA